MIDLHAELWSAIQALRPAHRERFGVPSLDCGVARIMLASGGTYELDCAGTGALLFPVFDGLEPFGADLIDIVAWQPTSGALASRMGSTAALGCLQPALAYDEPLRLYRTPADWNGDPGGACVVDWDAAEIILLAGRAIITEDLAHGAVVEQRLKALRRRLTPKMPEIMVRA